MSAKPVIGDQSLETQPWYGFLSKPKEFFTVPQFDFLSAQLTQISDNVKEVQKSREDVIDRLARIEAQNVYQVLEMKKISSLQEETDKLEKRIEAVEIRLSWWVWIWGFMAGAVTYLGGHFLDWFKK